MSFVERIVALLKAIIEFIRNLFTPQTVTTSTLSVSTAGDLSPLGAYILSLTCNEANRNLWITNRAQAIAGSGLSQSDQDLLTQGNPSSVAAAIIQQSGGSGSRPWICIWIR